jgi:hypothetical protein
MNSTLCWRTLHDPACRQHIRMQNLHYTVAKLLTGSLYGQKEKKNKLPIEQIA